MPNIHRLAQRCLVFTAVACVLLWQVVPVFSQVLEDGILPGETKTQPKTRATQVTASVVDRTAPSVPILIAPENESTLTTNLPGFVWKESTDEFAIGKYELWLNGELLFGDLPTSDITTADYTYTYDSETGHFTLTPTQVLSDGAYTWKVIGFDIHNNAASSVTWTFTIDTTAPPFIITEIDNQTTSISAQDLATVPTTPFELSQNQPLLQGSGEALSSVTVTATLPTGEQTIYTFEIDEQGKWQLILGILPRDVIISLDFVITDQAGNISILNDLLLILRSQVIVIPPIGPFPEQEIPIPVVTPEEVVKYVTGNFVSLTAIEASPLTTVSFTFDWTALLLFLTLTFLPALKTLFLLSSVSVTDRSLRLLSRIWRVIGLYDLTDGQPQGIVVERTRFSPVTFAPVIFSGENRSMQPVKEVTFTNAQGVYEHINLPYGNYRGTISDEQCLFPTPVPPPTHLNWRQHYIGVGFSITDERPEPILIIPIEDARKPQSLKTQIKYAVLRREMLSLPLAIVSFVCLILFPTVLNCVVASVYCLLYLNKSWRNRKHVLEGVVVTITKEPLGMIVLIHTDKAGSTCRTTTQSDLAGEYHLKRTVEEGEVLEVISQSYCLPDSQQTSNTLKIDQEAIQRGYADIVLSLASEDSCPL